MNNESTPREVGALSEGLGQGPERATCERCDFMLAATREAQAFAAHHSDEVLELRAERDMLRNTREVLARWTAEACGVLFSVEEEAEDGGESLRMLRERGLRLVRAVLQPKPGELAPWLEDGPNVGIEPPRSGRLE